MHTTNGKFHLSASDLVNHLACRHLTELNAEVAAGDRAAPSRWDPMLELLRERGLAHERDYIAHLQAAGHSVTSVGGVGVDDEKVASTVEAMRSGHDIIVQGALADGRWSGRTDILRRVEIPSDLGGWSYEVIDTKLARETRSGTILQLSLYSDLVRSVQGVLPGAHVRRRALDGVRAPGLPHRRLRRVLPPSEALAGIVSRGPGPRADLPRPEGALPRMPLEPTVRWAQAR